MKLINNHDKETYSEHLAHTVLIIVHLAIFAGLCWLFKNVLTYVLLAVVVTLLGSPVCDLLCKIRIKGHRFPRWLGSLLSIFFIFGVLAGLLTTLVPLVNDMISDISSANLNNLTKNFSAPFVELNAWIVDNVPNVDKNLKIEMLCLQELQGMFTTGTVTSMVGSVTSFIADLGIAIFSTIFISFFFIKQPGMISSIVSALIPDKYSEKAKASLEESGKLVSRYFVGLAIEVLGVSLLNFIGLLLIARMGLKYSLGIAFMTGLLNIIPYIGPLLGGILGVSFSLIIRYLCASPLGLTVGFLPFVLILACIFIFTQLVDNSIYQPLIYSNSVKVHPLEIFIVFLFAGHIGGMFGMLVAIPSYTVIRVIAKQFLGNVKPIRELTGTHDKS
ncbi:MAG: AI-2E family transporter [Bacteroidales bacterium]|nr:AI-2E family transporter [Bacteroidales bacterium]